MDVDNLSTNDLYRLQLYIIAVQFPFASTNLFAKERWLSVSSWNNVIIICLLEIVFKYFSSGIWNSKCFDNENRIYFQYKKKNNIEILEITIKAQHRLCGYPNWIRGQHDID